MWKRFYHFLSIICCTTYTFLLLNYKTGHKYSAEAHLCNHHYHAKSVSITYSIHMCVCVCVCVCGLDYPTSNGNMLCYIVICGLSGSTTFFHIISQTAWVLGEKIWTKNKFWFSLQLPSWNISHSKKNSVRYYNKCTRYHLKYQSFL